MLFLKRIQPILHSNKPAVATYFQAWKKAHTVHLKRYVMSWKCSKKSYLRSKKKALPHFLKEDETDKEGRMKIEGVKVDLVYDWLVRKT